MSGTNGGRHRAWDQVELARHPDRPYSLDYINRFFEGFQELRGDRLMGDDRALVAGVGSFGERTMMVFGQQKGRTLAERVDRNFGMMHPEGYRKATRLAFHAGKFSFPILSLVDTPGAYPGARAEEHGIAGAIGKTIMEWFRVPVPVIAVIIGEGGSGGALGMASADRVLMLENSIYSVAMPEAAASIVARDVQQKEAAAESLQITARDVWTMGIVEEIIPEPPGGAHLDHDAAARAVGDAVARHLAELLTLSSDELLDRRYQRFRTIDTLLEDELEFGIPTG